MKSGNLVLFVTFILSLAACASSKVSTIPVTHRPHQTVKSIAMAPDGGLLADAVSIELSNRGFTVIDSATTSKMMMRLNLNEIEITQPQGLAKLREQGIDAILFVRSAGGYDQQPGSASARLNSTETGQVIAGY